MKKKIVNFFKKLRKKVAKYMSTNRLYITFIAFTMIETVLLRNFTIKNVFDYKPFICDLALLIIIGSFGYFVKPKKQFTYYFTWMCIVTTMCIVNSIYYVFYTSFASFSLLAELGLVGEVGDSLVEKFRIKDFIYLIFPLLYLLLHTKLKNGTYYHFVSKVEKGKNMVVSTILAGVIVLAFTLVNITGTDASRLVKQWNREYIVSRFGIILYQGNDLIQSLTPKINSLFGYDEAAKLFKDFFAKEFQNEHKDNKYTGVLEGMNVIFIHMESIQNYLVGMEVNGQEITPTLNKLIKEGMYFNNFYPQISIGTSSDTEFTLNTSLMPANSGTVFVQYFKRNYTSIPKLLKEKGYYTFSSHANGVSMWNRNNMHPSLGYEEMIFKDSFEVEEYGDTWVGLGLSDVDFFKQLQPMLEKIETEHENYMGTLIQLSNHSPFADLEEKKNPELYNYFGKLNLKNTYTVKDEVTGEMKTYTDDYLDGTKLGNYLISAHYGDMALGTFIDYVNNSEYYENTVFVLYGDHDARLDKSEYQYYYNYDVKNGILYEEGEPNYVNYDNFANEVNKKTPLVIWTKNKDVAKKIKRVNSNVMGMYDVLPTLGNMMGFENKYALGHDIYDIGSDNVVMFPNGNFITNLVYYNNTSGNYMILDNDNKVVIGEDYISDLKAYVEERLTISNDIIVHDLIEREGNNIIIDKEGGGTSGQET